MKQVSSDLFSAGTQGRVVAETAKTATVSLQLSTFKEQNTLVCAVLRNESTVGWCDAA